VEYKYDLQFQASNGGLKGFVQIDNYRDFQNCYVDINAAPECEAISISYTSVAIEECDDCGCDRFWISTENRKFDYQCECTGDGCDDIVWGRNVTEPISGEEDYYYYLLPEEDGSYNYTYIYNDYGTIGEMGASLPVDDGQIVAGNKFRFNFQSDMTISHGEVRLDWECIDAIETTEITTTDGTTTTTGTTTTSVYDYHYTTARTTRTTTTDFTTQWDNSCYRHHGDHDEFKLQVVRGIQNAVQGELYAGLIHESRRYHFNLWLTNLFNIYHDDITDEEKPRKCLLDKVGDSPGDLTMDELGSDCALDIENGSIENACSQLKSFFEWAYADCKTEGNRILERLTYRCNRINEIKTEYAAKQ
jgi:hypothetical protein